MFSSRGGWGLHLRRGTLLIKGARRADSRWGHGGGGLGMEKTGPFRSKVGKGEDLRFKSWWEGRVAPVRGLPAGVEGDHRVP